MNEFSKEELNHIANSLCLLMAKCSMEKKHYGQVEKLAHKIQSMIDNYCEHKWYPGGNRLWLHCIKCKANFHHEDPKA